MKIHGMYILETEIDKFLRGFAMHKKKSHQKDKKKKEMMQPEKYPKEEAKPKKKK